MTVFRSSLEAARKLSSDVQLRRRIAALFPRDTFLGEIARDTADLDEWEELCLVCALEGYQAAGGIVTDLDTAIETDEKQGRLL